MALGITRVIAANGMEKPPYLPFEFLQIPIDDDSDENISPQGIEICDEVDNDCDTLVDETFKVEGQYASIEHLYSSHLPNM